MIRKLLTTTLAAGLVVSAACTDSAPTAPLQRAASIQASTHDGIPNSGQAAMVQCENHPAYVGEGTIGPNGGQILIGGGSRLIVPPGALTRRVWIKAIIPAGENVTVNFEFSPHGLVFRKPLGLVLSAAGCDIPAYRAPSIAYVSESGEVGDYIQSFYSNYWHLVAAPIWHFSGYAVAF